MKYIVNTSNDPAYNIALEAYAFRELVNEDELFILWINRPAIIVGKHQNTIQEINKEYTDAHDIKVVRRLSGGGAVYHDLNNLNYTIISNKADEGAFDFKTFSQPVIATLADLGVKAEFTGRNDLEIDGKKFCGNAQAYYKGRMMHHGCLLFDVDMSVLGQALKVSKDKIESKGVKSVKSRITNVKDYMKEDIPLSEFKRLLLEFMFEEGSISKYKLTDIDIEEINKIKSEIYDKWEWNYGESPKYNILKERRFDSCGKVELYLEVENGVIKDMKIHGDYFGNGDTNILIEKLVGCKIESKSLRDALKDININDFFNNLNIDNFISLITE